MYVTLAIYNVNTRTECMLTSKDSFSRNISDKKVEINCYWTLNQPSLHSVWTDFVFLISATNTLAFRHPITYRSQKQSVDCLEQQSTKARAPEKFLSIDTE